MRWVTANQRELLIHSKVDEVDQPCPSGFAESITKRAVHELLYQPMPGNSVPFFPALMATRVVIKSRETDVFAPSPCTRGEGGGEGNDVRVLTHFPNPKNPLPSPLPDYRERESIIAIALEREKELSYRLVWVDSVGTFYPPAIAGFGISLDQLHILRPRPADVVWATIESLRCRSIGTVIASITHPLTRVEVRRLQLAAEIGGGIAILIRPNLARAANHIYAAATRWLVSPMPGERTIQRWRLELVHGHGRQIGQSFILEKNRATGQTYFVHPPAELVHHPAISEAS